MLSLNQQTASRICEACRHKYATVRGSVFADRVPVGLYLTALHGRAEGQPKAHLAVAILNREEQRAYAAALRLSTSADDFLFTFENWERSPFRDDSYLGEMLDRVDALRSKHKEFFLRVAEHVVVLPQVDAYLTPRG